MLNLQCNFSPPTSDDGTGYWLGATDDDVEGNFVWHGGIPMSYTYWRPGQPNDDHNPPQDCLMGTPWYDHRWQDKSCTETYLFVCEYIIPGSNGKLPHTIQLLIIQL